MASQPNPVHPVQLRNVFVSEIHGARSPLLDPTQPLSVPPYDLEQKMELLKPDAMVLTYRLYTAPLELMMATSKNAFYFDVQVTAEFSIGTEMPREQIEIFSSAGALLVLWPFVRQTVADLSMRLGFPPLYLPVLTVPIVAPAQTECLVNDRK